MHIPYVWAFIGCISRVGEFSAKQRTIRGVVDCTSSFFCEMGARYLEDEFPPSLKLDYLNYILQTAQHLYPVHFGQFDGIGIGRIPDPKLFAACSAALFAVLRVYSV
jgi:hypothetical protein